MSGAVLVAGNVTVEKIDMSPVLTKIGFSGRISKCFIIVFTWSTSVIFLLLLFE